jgi:glycosyltransferase involved in cell wall biosynthesis
VSVIIPCHNAGQWVGEAIESTLSQTYHPIEVIVIDDGSSDDSLDVIRSFGTHIAWRTGPNRGGNAARNSGLELSSGEYIQWLDADDLLVQNKIERQTDFLESHPECDVVYGDWQHLYQHSQLVGRVGDVAIAGNQSDVLEALVRGWWVMVSAYLVRREKAFVGGGWDESIRAAQDFDYWVGLALNGCSFCYQPGLTAVYRHHGDNTVSRNRRRWLDGKARVAEKVGARLQTDGRLHAAYRQALAVLHLNLARNYFDIDRLAYDGHLAAALNLDPGVARTDTPLYRAAARVVGHTGAERLARMKRYLLRMRAPDA